MKTKMKLSTKILLAFGAVTALMTAAVVILGLAG